MEVFTGVLKNSHQQFIHVITVTKVNLQSFIENIHLTSVTIKITKKPGNLEIDNKGYLIIELEKLKKNRNFKKFLHVSSKL